MDKEAETGLRARLQAEDSEGQLSEALQSHS
jgi:hypothetical protein